MAAMLHRGYLAGGDGTYDPERRHGDRLNAYGTDFSYELTPSGQTFITDLGVVLSPRRPAIRSFIDWSEQRHHLSGNPGRGLLDRLTELRWIRRSGATRAVEVTPAGWEGLATALGTASQL